MKMVAVLFALAACGKVKSSPVDGEIPPIDQAIDAPTFGPVTVNTYTRCCTNPDQLVGGIDIIAVDPDGTTRTVLTANGHASIDIHIGGTVTALYRTTSGGQLFTFANVSPGDVLTFGDKFTLTGNDPATMTAAFPAIGQSYRVFHNCGQASATQPATMTSIPRNKSCLTAAQDLLYLAFDVNGELIRWGFQDDIPFTDGSTTTLQAWQAPGNFTMTFSNLPDGTNVAAQIMNVLNNKLAYYDYKPQGVPTNGNYSYTRPWPPAGDRFTGGARFDTPMGSQFRSEALPVDTTQWVVSDPISLPWMKAATFDIAQRSATVMLEGTGAHDGIYISTSYSRGNPAMQYTWNLLASPGQDGANTFKLPDLPAALDSYEPTAGDTSTSIGATVWDYAQADGNAGARQLPEWVLGDLEGNILIEGGKASVEAFSPKRAAFFPPSRR